MVAGLWLQSVAVGSAQTLRVRSGDTVWMTETNGALSRGVVLGVEPSAVRVAMDGREQRRELGYREMWRDGDSLRNGIAWGALVGLGAGIAALATVTYQGEGGDVTGPLLLTTALGLGGGVAIRARGLTRSSGSDARLPCACRQSHASAQCGRALAWSADVGKIRSVRQGPPPLGASFPLGFAWPSGDDVCRRERPLLRFHVDASESSPGRFPPPPRPGSVRRGGPPRISYYRPRNHAGAWRHGFHHRGGAAAVRSRSSSGELIVRTARRRARPWALRRSSSRPDERVRAAARS